jgi:hypothetical protein
VEANDWMDLSALADIGEFDRVRAALAPEALAKFDRYWLRLQEARSDPEEVARIAGRVLQLLSAALPAKPDSRTRLATTAALDRPVADVVLAMLFDPSSPQWNLTDEDPVAALKARIRNWLLSAPAHDAARLAAAGTIGSPHLIGLPRPEGSAQFPSFQFDHSDAPIPVVVAVNEILGAAGDPWGAAGWWLAPSLWFPDPPAAMIGTVPDTRLVTAAHAAMDGEW